MEIFKRIDFIHHLDNGQISLEDDMVKTYQLRTGAICEVYKRGNTTNLVNGMTHFVNDELSKYLVAAGITGMVLIHHTSLNRGVPKWLTYSQHHKPFAEWCKHIKIFTFKPHSHTGDMVAIEEIVPMFVNVKTLSKVIDNLSHDVKCDGLLLEASGSKRINHYHMMPTRYCEATISSVISNNGDNKLVATIRNNDIEYLTLITKMTATMNNLIEEHGDKLVGKRIRVQYVSYVPGDRLENFSSITALFVINMSGV